MRAILYARVTTAEQREASIEDQLRECEDLCKRERFTIVDRVSDHGLSGSTAARPAYQRVLRAIEHGDADVVVAHELTRLWRNEAERAEQMEVFEFRGRHVVTCDGIDTRQEASELIASFKGWQAKDELKKIATRVHRSHKGNAIAGRSTGGRAYGYRSEAILDPVKRDAYGRPEIVGATRVIEPEAAEIVRRIFTLYADGASPREIASRLNAEGIPSPGAAWRRVTRRKDAKWLASAIHGDSRIGSGILNNELYRGVVIWNRRQMKKRPRTSKRVPTMRPAEEHIVREDLALRIVSDELWQRVKDRQAKQAHELGTRVTGGLRKHKPGAGRPARYLLSGLLKCVECGAGFVLANATRYMCASHTNGGASACAVSLSVPRERAERIIRECVEVELLDPNRLAEMEKTLLAHDPPPVDYSARLAELGGQERNLTTAIKGGGDIPTLLTALKDVQAERAKLQAAGGTRQATKSRKASQEPVERRAKRMLEALAEGGPAARSVMQALFPRSIWLQRDATGRFLWACFADGVGAALFDQEVTEFPLVGNSMVAGVGFEPTTFGL